MSRRVVSAILFSPRGGSAHAARALARGLRADGWSVTLLAGSRRDLGSDGDAETFYDEVQAVSFDEALSSPEPLAYEGAAGSAPMHPSYEDRPGAPDRVFAGLDDLDYERQVRAWERELRRAGAAEADVLHLHHLTPLNEAAVRVAPEVPIVGQLHGSELLMLERIQAGRASDWQHAERWMERTRRWAQRCARLVVAPAGVPRVLRLLDVPRARIVDLPNGVDTELFTPREVDRVAVWRRVLVDAPRGWLPDRPPGSACYTREQVDGLAAATVLVYVGRFTAVKRLDRLIAAFSQAQSRASSRAALVLVGGHPGEWEGEHPRELAERLGVDDVFLTGWYRQEELPELFAASDAVVLASEREQFGQVLVEGMACGLPVIAPRLLGPGMIVEDGRTGWLTEPGDEDALARAMIEAVDDPEERRRRGATAREVVRERFAWPEIAARFGGVLEEAIGDPDEQPATERTGKTLA
jgi:glycosyltransferase involved in cell wall biosynthesis